MMDLSCKPPVGFMRYFAKISNMKNVEESFSITRDKIRREPEDEMTNCNVNRYSPRVWREPRGKNDCDKENYNGAADTSYSHTPQRVHCKKVRQPLENCEENSQDSGHPSSPFKENLGKRCELYAKKYSMSRSVPTKATNYKMCPLAAALSPVRGQHRTTRSSTLLRSLSSGYESMDDGLMNELNDMETMDEEETQLPSGISKLLSGDIVAPEASTDYDVSTTPDFSRNLSSKVTKWLSVRNNVYQEDNIVRLMPPMTRTPPLSKIRTCLFRSPPASCSRRTMMRTYSYDEACYRIQMDISPPPSVRSYKRPSEDLIEDAVSNEVKKSRKFLDEMPVSATYTSTLTHPQITLQRSLSDSRTPETHTNIKWAIHRSVTDTDLIGDFSKPCILPLASGIHPDLKTITSDTLAALLRDEFADRVASYTIIDCRYPYEYEAGHVEGAVNVYNMDLVQQLMLDNLVDTVPKIQLDTDKRKILVFHCEFSWERGPNLSRLLRRLDRACNKEHYPALHYPEIYLLLGGYKNFYSEYKEFCSPQDYKPMKHPNHEEECRYFRSKCKSWQSEKAKAIGQTVRANLERFAF